MPISSPLDSAVSLRLRAELSRPPAEDNHYTSKYIDQRRFRRVRLEPRQSTVVRFRLGMDDLSFYDARMRRVAEPGGFRVMTGGSSRDVQEARFQLTTRDGQPVPVPERCGTARLP
ncbi:MAG TPA: fibronectin type III-like domain-contianing protein [Longimicrobium sp.]